jgi:hypothetical protein
MKLSSAQSKENITMLNRVVLVLILIISCLIVLPVYSGELYETQDYFSSTIGIKTYDYVPPPVGSPDFPSFSENSPFSPHPDNPVPDNSPDNNGGSSDFGNYGNGNFNQLFGFDNQSFWTNYDNRNQTVIEMRDYLTQAILTNRGHFVRNRGRYAKQTQEITGKNIGTLSGVSRFLRKTPDKQITYKKVQKSIKTPFERCYQTTFISADYLCDGFETSIFEMNFSAVAVFNFSA